MLEYWVINALIFSLPFSWYMLYQHSKTDKKKDEIIDKLTNIICKNANVQ